LDGGGETLRFRTATLEMINNNNMIS